MSTSVLNQQFVPGYIPGLIPGGRLTLVTATPVMTSTQSAKTSVYYTPHQHSYVPIYDGTGWSTTAFSELTLALDSASGHTGYHQSGKNFDLFVYNDSGTLRLVSGPAWSSDTARATALERVNGYWMNAASMTAKYDSSASTLTVARDRGLYVGTIRANADGQTAWIFGALAANGTKTEFLVWNCYNRVDARGFVADTTDSWTYSTAAWRPSNNSSTMRFEFVRGLDEDVVDARWHQVASSISAVYIGIVLDSTSATPEVVSYNGNTTNAQTNHISWAGLPGIGFHYLQLMEYGHANVSSYYGDSSAPTILQSGAYFTGRF